MTSNSAEPCGGILDASDLAAGGVAIIVEQNTEWTTCFELLEASFISWCVAHSTLEVCWLG
jgi:hypothetical protein